MLRTHVQRGANRVASALTQAARTVVAVNASGLGEAERR